MYRPQVSKSMERQEIKEKKRQQLVMLLCNKFRSKFNVNQISEPEIETVIRDKINELLKDGNTYEAHLNKLDQSLGKQIYEIRQNKNKIAKGAQSQMKVYDDTKLIQVTDQMNGSKYSNPRSSSGFTQRGRQSALDKKAPGIKTAADRSNYGSQQSNRNQKLQKAGQGIMSTHNIPIYDGKTLTYEDPSKALNLDDKKWNSIVQTNLENFRKEKIEARETSRLKNQLIRDEQYKQVESKRLRENHQRNFDITYFKEVGIKSSDVYYKNEDEMIERQNAIKGRSHFVSLQLREEQNEKVTLKYKKMATEAAVRQKQQQSFLEEERLSKMKILQKKTDLKKQQEIDQNNKQDVRQKQILLEKGINDFAEGNLFTDVYNGRVHQSIELAARNEKRLGFIKAQFGTSIRNNEKDQLAQKFYSQLESTNKKQSDEWQHRADDRKRKEYEAKLYQDQQVAEKGRQKILQTQLKAQDHMKIQDTIQKYKMENTKAKEARMKKNKDHLQSVFDQMTIKPKEMFTKTGVGII